MAEDRVLAVGVESVAVSVSPRRSVTILMPMPKELAAAPGLHLGIDMTPAEAREIATMMLRKADEAEGGSPRH